MNILGHNDECTLLPQTTIDGFTYEYKIIRKKSVFGKISLSEDNIWRIETENNIDISVWFELILWRCLAHEITKQAELTFDKGVLMMTKA